MESFQYEALQAEHFRLLYLTLGKEGNLIGELQHQSREKARPYDAISYAWNGEEATEPIICNKQQLSITKSLFGAFYAICSLRLQRPVCIWADGVCVNQKNDSEKSVQVPLMREYYSNAKQVLVWLGQAGEATDHPMDNIQNLNVLLGRAPDSALPSAAYLLRHYLPRADDAVWSGVRDIFYRNWFSRLWVVQEVALGQEVVAMCGSKSIPWSQLSRLAANLKRTGVINIVRQVREWIMTKWDGIGSIGTFDRHKAARKEGRSCDLTTLCMDVRWRQTSNPLDKVYGILGFLDDETRKRIIVDYSNESKRDFWKAYRAFSLLILKQSSGLFMLRIAASSERLAEAPSWCVNLNSAERSSMFSRGLYQAGGPVESRDDPNADINFRSISSDQRRLKLRGYRVDVVSDSVPTELPHPLREPKSGLDGTDSKMLAWMLSCSIRAAITYGMPNAFEQVGRTLIANVLHDPPIYNPVIEELKPSAMDALFSLQLSKDDKNFFRLPDMTEDRVSQMARYKKSMHIACNGRRFFCTRRRRIGLGPEHAKPGDSVFVFKGVEVPLLFRPQLPSGTWSLVGEAYVHGLMNGEGVEDLGDAHNPRMDLVIA